MTMGTSTASVNANAVGQSMVTLPSLPGDDGTAYPPLPTIPAATGRGVALGTLMAALVLAGVAIRWPIPLTVMGLATFGIAHVILEVRYVLGRFAVDIPAVLGGVLVLGLTGVALTRLVAPWFPAGSRTGEIVCCWLILAAAATLGLRGHRRVLALLLLAAGAAASLVWPAHYFFAITHLHNIVPLVFLVDWARRIAAKGARAVFLTSQLVWTLLIPAAILLGAFDGVLSLAPGIASGFIGDGATVVRVASPPGAEAVVAARFCVAFSFLQSMHYVTWLGTFPAAGGEPNRRFAALVPALRSWRLWALVAVATLAVGAVFATSYGQGRYVYSVIAGYHVYLEFPLLLLIALGAARLSRRVAQ